MAASKRSSDGRNVARIQAWQRRNRDLKNASNRTWWRLRRSVGVVAA
jgi:hypothetical protein